VTLSPRAGRGKSAQIVFSLGKDSILCRPPLEADHEPHKLVRTTTVEGHVEDFPTVPNAAAKTRAVQTTPWLPCINIRRRAPRTDLGRCFLQVMD